MLVESFTIMVAFSAFLLLFGAKPSVIVGFWFNLLVLVFIGIFIGMGIDVYTFLKVM